MIGQTISHYKILEKLGEGGMGVVYKARDITLDRDVALKFLPGEFSSSEEEKSRFLHEAKAASALDHPNICTIYEAGQSPDGRMFIAMGYYEGAVLSKKIEKGRLDVAEAVWIAIQIAEGLQAAHGKGIVHRDIKSSNIIVSDQGQVRILDFGLARKKGLSKLTKTGTTVGTASYMSPEQAQGGKVDHRTDLWSLGVILYEMVTGHLPFRGEHEAAILYSVVNAEPQPIQAIVPDASPELVHIIRRALEKDPSNRYQSAADMLIDLRRLKKDTSRIGYSPVTGERKKLSSRRNKILIAAVLLVMFCVLGYLFLFNKGVEINPNSIQRSVEVPFKQVSAPGISPDGKYLVFSGEDEKKQWHLYVARASGGESRPITQDTIQCSLPNFSPDGNEIVYRRGPECEICVVPFDGGIGKKIGIGVSPKWSPDGKRIGYILFPFKRETNPFMPVSESGNAEFWIINSDGSNNKLVFIDTIASKQPYDILSYAWSPDGNSVAWVRNLPAMYSEIVIHDLRTHVESRIISDTTGKDEICWGSNYQIVYSSHGKDGWNLWTISSKGGNPVPITKGTNNIDYPTISSNNRWIAFSQVALINHLWIAKLNGENVHSEVSSQEATYEWPAISPDGKQIVYCATMPSSDECHIYLINRDGSNRRQLTFSKTYDDHPRWSPDGKFISYESQERYSPPESVKTFILNMKNFETPRMMRSGSTMGWKDSSALEVRDNQDHNKFWTVYLDGRPAEQLSNDSISAYSVLDGKYILFRDDHRNSDTLWKVCKVQDWDMNGPSTSWAVWKGNTNGIVRSHGIYVLKSNNELIRISFLDGKQEKLPVTFSDFQTYRWRMQLTQDGTEMCYKTSESRSKLGVIENPFR